jgi:glycosyltransferase involved in cell wall biosynthesis
MRVLLLTPLFAPRVGGLEIFVRQLARQLVFRKHDVAIVTSHGDEVRGGLDQVDGIPLLRIDAHAVMETRDMAGILRVQLELARFAREFAADVVHSHDVGPVLWMYQRSARQLGAPLVVTLHNVMSRKLDSGLPVITKMLRGATWTTGVSQAVVDDVLRYAPCVAATSSVIRNGIEPLLCDASVRDGRPRLACIGRLHPQKGFDLAIRAFTSVRATHPGALLVIAGDGPERSRLTALADDMGVSDAVEFLGEIDRRGVARVLSESTIVVIPSHYEGLPLVALEAAFAGRPVIATDAPGLSEAVVRGKTALVVPANDPDALGAAMVELVGDPERVRTMGRAARAVAEARYSLKRCVDAYERLYADVAENQLAAVPR